MLKLEEIASLSFVAATGIIWLCGISLVTNDVFDFTKIKYFMLERLGETYRLLAEPQVKQGKLAEAPSSINKQEPFAVYTL